MTPQPLSPVMIDPPPPPPGPPPLRRTHSRSSSPLRRDGDPPSPRRSSRSKSSSPRTLRVPPPPPPPAPPPPISPGRKAALNILEERRRAAWAMYDSSELVHDVENESPNAWPQNASPNRSPQEEQENVMSPKTERRASVDAFIHELAKPNNDEPDVSHLGRPVVTSTDWMPDGRSSVPADDWIHPALSEPDAIRGGNSSDWSQREGQIRSAFSSTSVPSADNAENNLDQIRHSYELEDGRYKTLPSDRTHLRSTYTSASGSVTNATDGVNSDADTVHRSNLAHSLHTSATTTPHHQKSKKKKGFFKKILKRGKNGQSTPKRKKGVNPMTEVGRPQDIKPGQSYRSTPHSAEILVRKSHLPHPAEDETLVSPLRVETNRASAPELQFAREEFSPSRFKNELVSPKSTASNSFVFQGQMYEAPEIGLSQDEMSEITDPSVLPRKSSPSMPETSAAPEMIDNSVLFRVSSSTMNGGFLSERGGLQHGLPAETWTAKPQQQMLKGDYDNPPPSTSYPGDITDHRNNDSIAADPDTFIDIESDSSSAPDPDIDCVDIESVSSSDRDDASSSLHFEHVVETRGGLYDVSMLTASSNEQGSEEASSGTDSVPSISGNENDPHHRVGQIPERPTDMKRNEPLGTVPSSTRPDTVIGLQVGNRSSEKQGIEVGAKEIVSAKALSPKQPSGPPLEASSGTVSVPSISGNENDPHNHVGQVPERPTDMKRNEALGNVPSSTRPDNVIGLQVGNVSSVKQGMEVGEKEIVSAKAFSPKQTSGPSPEAPVHIPRSRSPSTETHPSRFTSMMKSRKGRRLASKDEASAGSLRSVQSVKSAPSLKSACSGKSEFSAETASTAPSSVLSVHPEKNGIYSTSARDPKRFTNEATKPRQTKEGALRIKEEAIKIEAQLKASRKEAGKIARTKEETLKRGAQGSKVVAGSSAEPEEEARRKKEEVKAEAARLKAEAMRIEARLKSENESRKKEEKLARIKEEAMKIQARKNEYMAGKNIEMILESEERAHRKKEEVREEVARMKAEAMKIEARIKAEHASRKKDEKVARTKEEALKMDTQLTKEGVTKRNIELIKIEARMKREQVDKFSVAVGLLLKARNAARSTGRAKTCKKPPPEDIALEMSRDTSSYETVYELEITDPIQLAGFRVLSKSAIPIQSEIRRFLAQREAIDRMWAVIEIQSYFRRWRCEAFKMAHTHSAIKIQAVGRGRRGRCVAAKIRAAEMLQCLVRGWLARDAARQIRSALKIQAAFRGWMARDRLDERRCVAAKIRAAEMLQCLVRGWLARDAARQIRSALKIQAAFRGWMARDRLDESRYCACEIQRIVRGYYLRRCLARSRAAILLQASWRSYSAHLHYQFDVVDINIVQSLYRRWAACKVADKKRRFQAMSNHEAACTIQKTWRGFQAYTDFLFHVSDIVTIQRCVRRRLAVREAAAIRVQSAFRQYTARMNLLVALYHIILVQSVVRRRLALNHVLQKLAEDTAARKIQFEWRLHNVNRGHKWEVASIMIQKTWRSFWQNSHYIIMQYECVKIQSLVRGHLARCDSDLRLGCAIILQTIARRYLSKNRVRETRLLRTIIDSASFSMRERLASRYIESWWKEQLLKRKQKKAALVISRFFRMVKAEVDNEIRRRKRKLNSKRRARGRRETEDKVLERAWLNTVDSFSRGRTARRPHSAGRSRDGVLRSRSPAARLRQSRDGHITPTDSLTRRPGHLRSLSPAAERSNSAKPSRDGGSTPTPIVSQEDRRKAPSKNEDGCDDPSGNGDPPGLRAQEVQKQREKSLREQARSNPRSRRSPTNQFESLRERAKSNPRPRGNVYRHARNHHRPYPNYRDQRPTDSVNVIKAKQVDDHSDVSGITSPSTGDRMGPSRLQNFSGKELADDLDLEEAWIDAEIRQANEKRRADEKYFQKHGIQRTKYDRVPSRRSEHEREHFFADHGDPRVDRGRAKVYHEHLNHHQNHRSQRVNGYYSNGRASPSPASGQSVDYRRYASPMGRHRYESSHRDGGGRRHRESAPRVIQKSRNSPRISQSRSVGSLREHRYHADHKGQRAPHKHYSAYHRDRDGYY